MSLVIMVCGRHGCGRRGHCLWPSLSNPMVVIVVVVVMVSKYRRDASDDVIWLLFYDGEQPGVSTHQSAGSTTQGT